MWKIRTLKSNGKQSMKKNFASCLIVSLIMVFLVSGALSITETIDESIEYINEFGTELGAEKIVAFSNDLKELEDKFRSTTTVGDQSSKGFISGLYHSTKKTGSTAGGFLLIIDKLFLKDDVSTTIIIACGTIISLLFSIFVQNILRIGTARFFMENQLYEKTHINRILIIYRSKKTFHCAWIMLTRIVFNLLWLLTIVGGIIKFYSYRMIPYILAENPTISRKDAFKLSMKMMKGHKFKTFMLDVTFLPWWILSIITFGFVQYLYLEPYIRSAYAELYFAVRKEAIGKNISESEYLNDKYLTEKTTEPVPPDFSKDEYPAYLFIIPEPQEKKGPAYDYHRKYAIYNLILIFFAFAMFGWIWECTLQIIQDGHFVNRGSLYGPWVPIYGFGGISLVVLLKRFADHPIVTFLLAMLVCGILEGGTGWYLDTFRGMRYWDYSNFYFNIHGYVCLEGLLVFGLGGCMFIYLLAPMLDTYLNKIPKKGRIALCTVLVSAFLADVVYTHFNPHTGDGIGGYVEGNGGTDAL